MTTLNKMANTYQRARDIIKCLTLDQLVQFYVHEFGESVRELAKTRFRQGFCTQELLDYLESDFVQTKKLRTSLESFLNLRPNRKSSAACTDVKTLIMQKCEDGLESRIVDANVGRGVFTTKPFKKGDFICEYAGKLLTGREAKIKESESGGATEYMMFFNCQTSSGVKKCIDATKDNGRLGRLINHSKQGNIINKIVLIEGTPRVYFEAAVDIEVGIELRYDYKETRREAIEANPWLAGPKTKRGIPVIVDTVFNEFQKEFHFTTTWNENMLDRSWDISICSEIGGRNYMEDSIIYTLFLLQKKQYGCFGIFDGHGGKDASKYARQNLLQNVMELLSSGQSEVQALRQAFLKCHNDMEQEYRKWPPTGQHGISTAGTTATLLLICEDHYFLAWVGDSNVFVIPKNDEIQQLTIPHKPTKREEVLRIIRTGGRISYREGSARIVWTRPGPMGITTTSYMLNMSRALGNFWSLTDKNEYSVSPEPSVKQGLLENVHRFIIGSDGLDNLPPASMQKLVDAAFASDNICPAQHVVRTLLNNLKEKLGPGYSDNTTCAVISMQQNKESSPLTSPDYEPVSLGIPQDLEFHTGTFIENADIHSDHELSNNLTSTAEFNTPTVSVSNEIATHSNVIIADNAAQQNVVPTIIEDNTYDRTSDNYNTLSRTADFNEEIFKSENTSDISDDMSETTDASGDSSGLHVRIVINTDEVRSVSILNSNLRNDNVSKIQNDLPEVPALSGSAPNVSSKACKKILISSSTLRHDSNRTENKIIRPPVSTSCASASRAPAQARPVQGNTARPATRRGRLSSKLKGWRGRFLPLSPEARSKKKNPECYYLRYAKKRSSINLRNREVPPPSKRARGLKEDAETDKEDNEIAGPSGTQVALPTPPTSSRSSSDDED